MNLLKTLTSSVGGTSLMSLFSYMISEKKQKNFREPEILGELIQRVIPAASETQANIGGWALHYTTGTVFTALYDQVWEKTSVKPNVMSGAVLGAISGLAGIAIWRATIAAHPNPPIKDYKAYYKHLMLAHIFFGIAAAESYKHTKEIKPDDLKTNI